MGRNGACDGLFKVAVGGPTLKWFLNRLISCALGACPPEAII